MYVVACIILALHGIAKNIYSSCAFLFLGNRKRLTYDEWERELMPAYLPNNEMTALYPPIWLSRSHHYNKIPSFWIPFRISWFYIIIHLILEDDDTPNRPLFILLLHTWLANTETTTAQWISETGVIEAFFFPGPTPRQVFSQYAALTGFPTLPPLFSLGYHQCRFSYYVSTTWLLWG